MHGHKKGGALKNKNDLTWLGDLRKRLDGLNNEQGKEREYESSFLLMLTCLYSLL